MFDVSFSVGAGEVFGFLGPNGAGKSTTIRHLMGFSQPQKGQTLIEGKDSWKHHDQILKQVGYIPGEIALPAGLSGWDFLNMMAELKGCQNRDYLNSLLKRFELDPKGDTKRMSMGVKRKLAIVAAFMNDPAILIMDEPTSGLDPVMQDVFIDYIKQEQDRGKSILLSSHIFSEVDATCQRIAIIKDGRIVDDFDAASFRHKKNNAFEVHFASPGQLAEFKARYAEASGFTVETSTADTAVIGVNDDTVNELTRALAAYDVASMTEHKVTLQDRFIKFYKEDLQYEGVK